MKIIFYINTIGCGGGAERVISQLANYFAENDCDSIMVNSFEDINGEYELTGRVKRFFLEEPGVRNNFIVRNISRIIGLRKIIRSEKPDAVVSFMGEANFRSIIATRGLNTKTIISVRNDPNQEYAGKIGHLIGKYLLPLADGCVFQTEDARAWFPKKLQKKSQVIMNDVDLIFFNTPYVGSKDVVTLGRLCDQKNHKLLISAYARIAEYYPDWRLCIYGTGPLEQDLKELIAKKHMQDHIFLMGLTDCAQDVLAHAGIFVLSSDYEGMPNALLEALAVGVPSISTDCPCGGPKMMIKDGDNGLLVPIRDEGKLAEAVCTLLKNEQYAKRLGENARKNADLFRPGTVLERWKVYLEEVISDGIGQ